ncbi:helix-turn-helix domain-containing protein, partial [Streptomyces sp. NPDC002491]
MGPRNHGGGPRVARSPAAETSQTLDRGLKVLKLLADTDHGLTVTELSN